MELIERKVALAAGLNTYYTGKPCRNGHVAYRYAQSGSCSECINGARVSYGSGAPSERHAAALQEQERRKNRAAAMSQLVPCRLALRRASEWQEIRELAICLTVLRFPVLEESDVDLMKAENSGCLRRVRLHPDDFTAIKEFQEYKISHIRSYFYDWINSPHPIQAIFSRGFTSGSDYPYVEFKGAWFSHAEIVSLIRGEIETIREVRDIPDYVPTTTGLPNRVQAFVGAGVTSEDLKRAAPEWHAKQFVTPRE